MDATELQPDDVVWYSKHGDVFMDTVKDVKDSGLVSLHTMQRTDGIGSYIVAVKLHPNEIGARIALSEELIALNDVNLKRCDALFQAEEAMRGDS